MVEYLSGERIQGSSTADKQPNYESDFSSDTWTTDGTGMAVDTGNDEIDYTNLVIQTGTNQKISYDLGSGNVSNDKWVLRYTLTPSDFSADSAVFGFISDTINPNLENSTDSIGTAINSNGGNTFFTGSYSNASKLNYDNQINISSGGTALTNGTPYYVEIRRTSTTAIDFTIRTGSHSGTTYGSWSGATVAGVVGLRYIVFGNANWGNGSATGSGTIKDIKFWNNATSTQTDEKDDITNVPANTRYEEIDTRKIFRRALGNASIPDLSSSTGWTEVDAGSCTFDLDTSNEKIDFSSGMNSSFSGISYDLQTILGSGTNASDTKWILRFKLTPTSTPPNDSSIAIMLSSGQNETTGTSADRVGFYLYTASNWNMFDFGGYSTGGTQFYTDGSGWGASLYGNDTSIAKGTDPLFIEIKRTSSTSATMSITTNSDYTTGAYTKTTTGSTTLPSTVQNLRYLTFQNAQNSTNSNRIAGKIEDIKFYNDITTPLDDRWVERNTAA